MAKHLIIPALADLRDDIAGPFPLDLIRDWLASDRSEPSHTKLLAPFARRGTVVKSDSAGLSKLTKAMPLIDVLKLVHDPKEIIARHGLAIGGEAIGTWIADDTQLFFPETVPLELVIEAMVSAQIRNRANPVQVGMAIHRGVFYHIGGGLYGHDAELVEEIGENETKGGEILVVEPRHSVDTTHATATVMPLDSALVPAPFSPDFLSALRTYTVGGDASFARPFTSDHAIILVRIFHPDQPLLLDAIAESVAANAVITAVAARFDVEKVKANGMLGIFASSDDAAAADFALALTEALIASGFVANTAVSRGEVYRFTLMNGTQEIAGSPVNLASKLAEDTEERNRVYVHDSCALRSDIPRTPFTRMQSGVALAGWELARPASRP